MSRKQREQLLQQTAKYYKVINRTLKEKKKADDFKQKEINRKKQFDKVISIKRDSIKQLSGLYFVIDSKWKFCYGPTIMKHEGFRVCILYNQIDSVDKVKRKCEENNWQFFYLNDGNLDSLLQFIHSIVERVKFLGEKSKELNAHLPISEQWFLNMFQTHELYTLFKFQHNVPIENDYIADLCSTIHKVVIEIDGSSHDTPEQKMKDWARDKDLRKHGYLVIRVKYNDLDSYYTCIDKLRRYARTARLAKARKSRQSWRKK